MPDRKRDGKDQGAVSKERDREFAAAGKPREVRAFSNLRRFKSVSDLALVVFAAGAIALYVNYNQRSTTDHRPGIRLERKQQDSEPLAPAPLQAKPVHQRPPSDAATHDDTFQVPAVESSASRASSATVRPAPEQPALARHLTSLEVKVYLHTSLASDRSVLEEVGDALRVQGYSIPDTRLTSGKTDGDVRFFFGVDRREAQRVKSLVESELARRGYRLSLHLLERDGRKFQFAAPGKIEVWLPPLPKTPQPAKISH